MLKLLNKFELGLSTYWQALKLLKSQYSKDKIAAIQEVKFKRIVHFAFTNVKYYKELFKSSDMSPEKIQSVRDIQKLPVTTKGDFRSRFWDFLPREISACRISRTSGSTGVPVCILSDINSRKYNSASVLRARKAAGFPFVGQTILTPLKHSSDGNKTSHWTYLQGVHKTCYINPYLETYESQIYAGQLLNSLNRPAIIGITPAIKALAERIHLGEYPRLQPCSIITGGDTLLPNDKDFIEEVFGQKVLDIYACNEAGEIGWLCPNSSLYHVNAENCILEILDENNQPAKEGQIGEVVITNLNRFSMPFIRYKNGDLARASYQSCSCGRKLPVIQEIVGRSGEDFYSPKGRKIQWNVLKGVMNHNLIRQFQLIQNSDSSVTVRYVSEEPSKASEIEKVLNERFAPLLKGCLSVSYEKVNIISQESSGKSKLVVCNYRPSLCRKDVAENT